MWLSIAHLKKNFRLPNKISQCHLGSAYTVIVYTIIINVGCSDEMRSRDGFTVYLVLSSEEFLASVL